MDILDNRSFESGIRGTYKSSSVDNYFNRVRDEVKRLESREHSFKMEIEDKKKRIEILTGDLRVAQDELLDEKSKSLEVDQRSIFIVEKERELANRAKEVEKQCSARIEEIGTKGQAHLKLANEKANEIIQEAQAKAKQIVLEAQTTAQLEIDKANQTIEALKKDFDESNTGLVDKQHQLANSIRQILSEVENLSYDSNLAGNIQYPQVDFTPEEVVLEPVQMDSLPATQTANKTKKQGKTDK
ncbi:MAG: hypothetical protein R3Y27_04915 [Clostridia bacterium]